MRNLAPTLALSLLGIPGQALAASEVIVAYNPSEYSLQYDVGFDRIAATSPVMPGTKVAVFSMSEPLLKSSETSYTGPSIYGGYQFATTNADWSFSREQIRHNAKGDHAITLQSYSGDTWAGADMALHALFLFKQEDFKPPFNAEQVSIEGLAIKWNTYFKGAERNVTGRYVVQISDKLYVSDFDFNMTNRGSSQVGKQNLASIKWAAYDASANLNFDDASAQYQTLALEDVTAVGLYVEDDRWIGAGSVSAPYMLSITSFQAKGEAR